MLGERAKHIILGSTIGVGCIVWVLILAWHIWRDAHLDYTSYQHGVNQAVLSGPKEVVTGSVMDGSEDNIFWFIHISDLHVSEFGGKGLENFQRFLQEVMPAVNPLFVLATGDLTDAKEEHGLGSRQFLTEWQLYQESLRNARVLEKKDFWFDLRGNHDCFDVDGWSSKRNLFATMSVTKKPSFGHVFELPFGNYGLIAIDGCPEYGPSRPFNFFGTLSAEKMDELESRLEQMKEAKAKHTFVISHYPIVTMQFQKSSKGKSFAELSNQFTAYFSGHLHNFFANLGKFIYAKHATGFLDLEIGDLKANREYRVAAIDNDVFSFVDLTLGSYPIILITNPKDGRFWVPKHEDFYTGKRSTHIRALLFSPAGVSSAHAFIDGEKIGELKRASANSSLWVIKWEPTAYAGGVHQIEIEAIDSAKQTNRTSHQFTLEEADLPIATFGQKMASFDFRSFIKRFFWVMYCIALALLLVPKLFSCYLKRRGELAHWRMSTAADLIRLRIEMSQIKGVSFIGSLVLWEMRTLKYRFVELTQHPYVFWTTLGLLLYLPIGPLIVGDLDHSIGVPSQFFLWGIWNERFGWTVILDTWMWCSMFMAFTVQPSLLFLALYCSRTGLYTILPASAVDVKPLHLHWCFTVVLVVWWLLEASKIIVLAVTYGVFSVLRVPGFAWFFLFVSASLVLFRIKLQRSCLHASPTASRRSAAQGPKET